MSFHKDFCLIELSVCLVEVGEEMQKMRHLSLFASKPGCDYILKSPKNKIQSQINKSGVWWYTPLILALRRQGQTDLLSSRPA